MKTFYFPEILKSKFDCLLSQFATGATGTELGSPSASFPIQARRRKNITICMFFETRHLQKLVLHPTSDCTPDNVRLLPPKCKRKASSRCCAAASTSEQYPSSNIHKQTTLDLEIKFHDANKWHQTWLSLGPCVCCGTLLGAPSDKSQNQIPTRTSEVHKPC